MDFGWNFFHKVETRITGMDTNEELIAGCIYLVPLSRTERR
jgi:hypothetical protein